MGLEQSELFQDENNSLSSLFLFADGNGNNNYVPTYFSSLLFDSRSLPLGPFSKCLMLTAFVG